MLNKDSNVNFVGEGKYLSTVHNEWQEMFPCVFPI